MTKYWRDQLGEFLESGISEGCRKAFAGDLAGLKNTIGSVRFWDTAADVIRDAPASFVDPGARFGTTIGGLIDSFNELAVTYGNSVVLSAQFSDLTFISSDHAVDQSDILFHELLHTYSGLSDVDLAWQLGVGNLSDSRAQASQKINLYLANDCIWGK